MRFAHTQADPRGDTSVLSETPETAPRRVSRRHFFVRAKAVALAGLLSGWLLSRTVAILGGILCLLGGYISLRFLWPRRSHGAGEWIPLAPVERIIPNGVETAWLSTLCIYVARQWDEGRERIIAFKATCTHLGCTTQWDGTLRQFVCPCHGSAFSFDGRRLRGPARRPLERCAVRVVQGVLLVNPHRSFRHEEGQEDDPRSFVVLTRQEI